MLKILRIFLTRASKMDEISSQNIWKNIGPLLAKYDIADQFLSITPFWILLGANGGSGVMWVYRFIDNYLLELKEW